MSLSSGEIQEFVDSYDFFKYRVVRRLEKAAISGRSGIEVTLHSIRLKHQSEITQFLLDRGFQVSERREPYSKKVILCISWKDE